MTSDSALQWQAIRDQVARAERAATAGLKQISDSVPADQLQEPLSFAKYYYDFVLEVIGLVDVSEEVRTGIADFEGLAIAAGSLNLADTNLQLESWIRVMQAFDVATKIATGDDESGGLTPQIKVKASLLINTMFPSTLDPDLVLPPTTLLGNVFQSTMVQLQATMTRLASSDDKDKSIRKLAPALAPIIAALSGLIHQINEELDKPSQTAAEPLRKYRLASMLARILVISDVLTERQNFESFENAYVDLLSLSSQLTRMFDQGRGNFFELDGIGQARSALKQVQDDLGRDRIRAQADESARILAEQQQTVSGSGDIELSQFYEAIATREKDTANQFRGWTLVLLITALGAAVFFVIYAFKQNESTTASALSRLVYEIPLVLLALYLGRQESTHRARARRAEEYAARLKTLKTFTEALNEETRNDLRLAVGTSILTGPPTLTAEKDKDNVDLDDLGKIAEIVDKRRPT